MDQLRAFLKGRQLLLVADNCEHLVADVARVISGLLSTAPNVSVLATSREPLSLAGESVVAVPPLQLPSHGVTQLARLLQNEAVALFAARAAAASEFELTETNRTAVVEICRQLDGLPLAIELAAVRTRLLGAVQLLDRLSDRFSLLTGGSRAALPRQQTLRTTIDWSYDLLDLQDQQLLQRLSLFVGRFTIDDVEAVADTQPSGADAMAHLASLVDKSLVTKDQASDPAAFRLHESMREYARIKLRQSGGEDAAAALHIEYYLRRCRRSPADSSQLISWLHWIEFEFDNIRAVLRACVIKRDAVRGLDLGVSLGWYWITRAPAEGSQWLDELLAVDGGHPLARGWASLLRGYLAVLQSDPDAARSPLEEAGVIARASSDTRLLSTSLSLASIAESMAGHETRARALFEEAGRNASGDDTPANVTWLEAAALHGFFTGDLEAVVKAASDGVRLCRETGAFATLDYMLVNLGFAALMGREVDQATTHFQEALETAAEVDDRIAQFQALMGLACCFAATRRMALAARLLGAGESIRVATGATINRVFAGVVAGAEQSAIGLLGAARFESEHVGGTALGRLAAIELALGRKPPTDPPAERPAHRETLGKREAEVAGLISKGLSNKEIAARLLLSRHTVDSHVRSILNKLGFNTRAQIAAWVGSSND